MQACRARSFSLWLLLAAALMLHALVPAGWMPDTGAGGSITLRICNAGTMMTIPLDRDGEPQKEDQAKPPCLFAGFADVAPGPSGDFELALLTPPEQIRVARLAQLRLLRKVYERPPGRAPPVRA